MGLLTERNWGRWEYVKPYLRALTDAFGVEFELTGTGGGCMNLVSTKPMENGATVYVGSCVNGPLIDGDERAEFLADHGYEDGFSVGTADYVNANGDALSAVGDMLATTPEQVVELVKRALALTNYTTPTQMRTWERDARGVIKEGWSSR